MGNLESMKTGKNENEKKYIFEKDVTWKQWRGMKSKRIDKSETGGIIYGKICKITKEYASSPLVKKINKKQK